MASDRDERDVEPTAVPRSVVMTVANGVLHDTRVCKSARAAAEAGMTVTVLGLAHGASPETPQVGGVDVKLLPRANRVSARLQRPAALVWRRCIGRASFAARLEARCPITPALERAEALLRATTWSRHALRVGPLWRRELPIVAALQRRCTPEIVRLRPQLIHAHDVTGLALAGPAVRKLRREGVSVRLVYDAHEWVRGLDDLAPARRQALVDLENRWAGDADAVLTVSPALADSLRAALGFRVPPPVVLNVPYRESRPVGRTVRADIGLDNHSPLLVYPGVVKPARGLKTAVEALACLEGVHLALICNGGQAADELIESAPPAVRPRIHILDFVSAESVAPYISDADIGINPLQRYGNGDVALPNKLFEYLHAGLPMVVSDARAVSELVRSLGLGEVHGAGDAKGFVRAVRRVLARPGDYRPSGEQRERLLGRYSWEGQTATLLRVYGQRSAGVRS